jgi:hypothetical protein
MQEIELINFVKTVTGADRLRIVGLVTRKPARLSEIIEILGFRPANTLHHLDKLVQSGILIRVDGFYKLFTEGLEELIHQQFKGMRQVYVPEPDLATSRSRVLAAHLNPNGTIRIIPAQPAKLRVILEYLIKAFAIDANFTEKEVNLILARFHPDTSALRRYMVDAGMLERERNGSRYWRPK